MASAAPAARTETTSFLSVNNIEVVYSSVITGAEGRLSRRAPRAAIVALLGANGAGKTTTLKAISNLLHAERGEVTKGAIVSTASRCTGCRPTIWVQRGCNPGDGGPPLFCPSHHRGEPADPAPSRAATARPRSRATLIWSIHIFRA
jgi:energy-coupling factor transporter ATP-binding protein EcfA2